MLTNVEIIREVLAISSNPTPEKWEELLIQMGGRAQELETLYQMQMGQELKWDGRRLKADLVIEEVEECGSCNGKGYTKFKVRGDQVMNAKDCRDCNGRGYK